MSQQAPILLLTAPGVQSEAELQYAALWAAVLTKPLLSHALSTAITTALEGPPSSAGPGLAPVSTDAPGAPGSLRILLAEDNAINQRFASCLLEKRGHAVVVVNNGKDVLTALAQQPFDLVLMDVQMPEMDGLETTAAIRAREQEQGGHMPIIAMTAHAMEGDRARCLHAGMDGYLTKPVRPHELFAAMTSLTPAGMAVGQRQLEMPPARDVFDQAALLARIEGDEALLQELVGLFLEDTPQRLDHLRMALASNDLQALARAAHTLKGSVGNMCAPRAFEVARHLERCAHTGDALRATDALTDFEMEMAHLQTVLSALITAHVP
jgi:CheY-like chemotaxis protein/HPt (histidine-containing phosphotransfer) domain-containing protein